MFVSVVSLRRRRGALAADIVEAAAALDVPGIGNIILAALVDAPASVTDTVDAFNGSILKETASATDTVTAGLRYALLVDEPASARDTLTLSSHAVISATIAETTTAADAPDSVVVPGGNEWTQVGTWTWSTNVAQVDFTGLAGWSEVRILARNITCSASGQRQVQVSTNNGSTFLSTSGDYRTVPANGVEANAAAITGHTTASNLARGFDMVINWFSSSASPKMAHVENQVTSGRDYQIVTTSALNAVRVNDSSGGNLTAGTIEIWAR